MAKLLYGLCIQFLSKVKMNFFAFVDQLQKYRMIIYVGAENLNNKNINVHVLTSQNTLFTTLFKF